jgi:ABC-type lipoprotein release transport system permease subunit
LIPLKYSVRNLWRRKVRTILTAFGVALGVFAGIGMLAAAGSLRRAIARNGEADQVLLYSRAATQLELSSIDAGIVETAATLDGVRVRDGVPLVSPEIYFGTLIDVTGGPQDRLSVVRAVTPAATDVHTKLRVAGGWPSLRGNRALVGRLAATKLGVDETLLQVGRTIEFEGATWTIAGVFDAPGTLLESEVWVDLQDLRTATRRDDLTHIVLAMNDAPAARALVGEMPWRTDIVVAAQTADAYYGAYAKSMQPLVWLAAMLALLVGAGGAFAALNTMSANVSARIREIGTLRAIGYSNPSVVMALAVESLVLAVAAAALGCLAVTAFQGLPLRMAMGAFRLEMSVELALLGVGIGAAIGLLGGVVPAWRGLVPPIAQAVRQV